MKNSKEKKYEILARAARERARKLLKGCVVEGVACEDVGQKVLEKELVAELTNTTDPIRNAKSFGSTFGHNQACSALRTHQNHARIKREKRHLEPVFNAEDICHFEDPIERLEEIADAKGELAQIRARCGKKAFDMFAYQVAHECSAAEVAEHFGTTPNAVYAAKKRVRKAARLLKSKKKIKVS